LDGVFTDLEFEERLTLNQRTVFAIHEDAEGTLWFGTAGGLIRRAGGRTDVYTADDGLPDSLVLAILEDEAGYLWMSCARGVFRISKQDLEAYGVDRSGAIPMTTFTQGDGMPSTECNGGTQPSAWKTRDGRLWFSTAGGVANLDPSDVRLDTRPSAVNIERVFVDREEVDHRDGLEMRASVNRLDVHYTVPEFIAPQRMRFQTLLEGFDDDWTPPGTARVTHYNNLPPGDHILRIRACNTAGDCSESEATLGIRKRPYLYQLRSFYLACGGLVVLTFVALYTGRVRQLRRRQVELEREVGSRSRQLVEAHNLLAEAKQLPIRFGPYVLISILGEGGMARVYRAIREGPMGFRKELAVKRVRTDVTRDNEGLVHAMINEARLGGQLRHPNVVETYEFGAVCDQFYIAMEYVDGWTFDKLLAGARLRGVHLPLPAVIDLMLQICDGLEYAHGLTDMDGSPLNLVHRDLKPANLILSRVGQAKIMDFGVARSDKAAFKTTVMSDIKGTLRFMSPEQLNDPRSVDGRSDLFAMGCIMFELVTGEGLLRSTYLQTLVLEILNGDYVARLVAVANRAPELVPVLERLTSPRPEDRYSSAGEVAAALRPLKRDAGDLSASVALGKLVLAASARDERAVAVVLDGLSVDVSSEDDWAVFARSLTPWSLDLADPYHRPVRSSLGVGTADTDVEHPTVEGSPNCAPKQGDECEVSVLWRNEDSES
jgi:serine/threonine protein kinase